MPINAESIQYGPWTGGVWYSKPVEDVQPDELADMQNCRIGTAGQVERRPGTASYQSAAAISGTPTLTFVNEFKPDSSTTHVVITAGTKFYRYNSGWSDTTGAATITAGDDNTFEGVNANGTLVITNGVDTDAIKWTGSGNAAALDDDARFSKGKHIAWFDNRLWIGNVNGAAHQVWYSDTGAIETWGATSFYNFGAEVTALVPMQNALAVHTKVGIYTLIATGNATIPYSVNQRTGKEAYGVDGHSVVAVPGDRQLFLMDDGMYMWTGGNQAEKKSYQLDDGYWDSINTARLHKTFALYFPRENEVWFALPYGASQTKMNHIMVYNVRFDRWHGPYKGWNRNCAALVSGKPHLGDFGGQLWDHDSGNNDNTSAIDAFFQTGSPAPFGSDVKARWLYARTFFDGQGNYNATVQQESSGLTGTTEVLNLNGNGFTLDTDSLDAGILGTDRMIFGDTDLSGYDPHCSLKYSMNATNQTFTIRRVHLQFKPLGRFQKDRNNPS